MYFQTFIRVRYQRLAVYQFKKAVFHGYFDTARYAKDAPTGGVAKRRSKHVLQTRRGWGSIRLAVLRSFVREKVRNKELRKALLDTADTKLIEAVPSAEGYCGLRFGFKEGMNVTGSVLITIRKEAKREAAADVKPSISCSRRVYWARRV